MWDNGKEYEYAGDLDELVEVTLTQLNNTSENKLEKLEDLTIQCLKMSYKILGKGAFRRELQESKPINMNIFEVTLYFMSLMLKDAKRVSDENVYADLQKMINNELFLRYIGNSRDNSINVYGRFKMTENLWRGISYDQ